MYFNALKQRSLDAVLTGKIANIFSNISIFGNEPIPLQALYVAKIEPGNESASFMFFHVSFHLLNSLLISWISPGKKFSYIDKDDSRSVSKLVDSKIDRSGTRDDSLWNKCLC